MRVTVSKERKTNSKLYNDIDAYKKQIKVLKTYDLRNLEIDGLNEEQLKDLEVRAASNVTEIGKRKEELTNRKLQRLEETQHLSLCKGCMKREKNVMILDCGHSEFCSICLPGFKDCPRCGQSFDQRKIFIFNP